MAKESRGGAAGARKSGNHRLPRVEKEIRDVIGMYLLTGFRGELPGLVTVTRVVLTSDLRQAKALVTVMGEDADRKAAVQQLQSQAHEVQAELNRKLRMKFVPKVTFAYDEGYEKAIHVEKVLLELRKSSGNKADDNQ